MVSVPRVSEVARAGAPQAPATDRVLANAELDRLRSAWDEVQERFTDDPRAALRDTEALVARAVKLLTDRSTVVRRRLEANWERGEDVDPECLRAVIDAYREVVARLLME
jgi:hypothetical protein